MSWTRRIERLARLREWAEQERDQLYAEVTVLEQQKQELYTQVQQLQDYLSEYVGNAHQEVSFVSQLLAQNIFVERLNQAIEATQAKVPPIDEKIQGLTGVLAEKQQRVKLLEILHERWCQNREVHLSKQEQQMLDDWVQQKNSQKS
ncbi:hypothetical protein THIAE_07220 [Thiomicrospira aerophila AL3]|uniref:Flagellar FliJ protein n=1 Tax=Thiomicrospira aerophila AL3 TaxID=717772 RepID=W0DZB2_9GAMM|nr:flagellar export protein FliJ [Thiomicrospira aerophila]AHF02324.1 hypothetical protein THIAE_07220 [Thiomicrospira aerophila AL3]